MDITLHFDSICRAYRHGYSKLQDELDENLMELVKHLMLSIQNEIKFKIICGNGRYTYILLSDVIANFDDGSSEVMSQELSFCLRDYIEYGKCYKLNISDHAHDVLYKINGIMEYWVDKTGGCDVTV